MKYFLQFLNNSSYFERKTVRAYLQCNRSNKDCVNKNVSISDGSQWGQGPFIIQAFRSHSDTPHSVGLLWMIDQPDAETST
jgi:hypothetical protein